MTRLAEAASKYRAVPCDGTCGRRPPFAGKPHASKRECNRWRELLLLERAGQIRDLKEQVVFVLAPATVLGGRKKPAIRYVADWTYLERAKGGWHPVVEDAKGLETPVFRIKAHLLKVVHQLEVRVA